MYNSEERSDNIYKKYTLCIYKARRKDYVDQYDLMARLLAYKRWTGCNIIDFGYHLDGRYNQLHLHAIVEIQGWVSHSINQMGWSWVTEKYYSKKYTQDSPYYKYIHSDDHDNIYRKEMLFTQNRYINGKYIPRAKRDERAQRLNY